MEGVIVWLIVGGVAGWLAGLILNGSGFGVIGDIIIGLIGGWLGGWLISEAGVSFGTTIVGQIVVAVIGAVVLLLIIKAIKKVL
jgi:uncharacterized membrane protein YeaQ/YmgE (transglycosylase-associated protein family)